MKEYINTIISSFSKFPEIRYIHVIPSDGSIEAAAVASENTILIRATGPKIAAVEHPMCLGNLKYLAKVVATDQIKGDQGTTELVVGQSLDQTSIVRHIHFIGPRIRIPYETTDPKAGNVSSVPSIKNQVWSAKLTIEPTVVREFRDAVGLQSLVNADKTDFKVVQRGEDAFFVFETGSGSDKDIELSVGKFEGEMAESPMYLNASRFGAAISLGSESEGATLTLSKSAAKIEFHRAGLEYEIIMPKSIAPGAR